MQLAKIVPTIQYELESTKYRDLDLVCFFERNKNELKEVALFGGAIRDVFLFGKLPSESDLDFVVNCDANVLRMVLVDFKPIENKFGGFRFKFGKRIIDIWSLSETWAIKKGYVQNDDGMMDLLSTTFFNVDSVYYRVFEKTLICSKKFKEGIESRVLDINLSENPSPHGIYRRIKKMNLEKDLKSNLSIKKYIRSNCGE
ncbi:hypothetical protein [Comamonas guangdongensis]|uniref:Poly A polymerase head domain-containing protein n=1 Tax=Comamonas guangdongensis TaxID=510515 RepID=A0ABV3ZYR8_9BURK